MVHLVQVDKMKDGGVSSLMPEMEPRQDDLVLLDLGLSDWKQRQSRVGHHSYQKKPELAEGDDGLQLQPYLSVLLHTTLENPVSQDSNVLMS